jgi:hypothetical protein
VDTVMTIDITAQRGTRVPTSRPSATSVVAPFGDQKWAGVRLDGHVDAMGQTAWSPPI